MRSLIVAVILCLLTAQWPVAAFAQNTSTREAEQRWAIIKALPVGERLIVKRKSGHTINALFGGATDATVSLVRQNRVIDLDRSDVRKIYRVDPDQEDNKRTYGSIGGFAGFFVGLLLLAGIGLNERSKLSKEAQGTLAAVAVPGGIIGGVIAGRAIGGHFARELIYQAP